MKKIFAFLIIVSVWSLPVRAKYYERQQLVFGDVLLKIRIQTQQSQTQAFEELKKGFAEAKKQEKIFSTFQPDSELSKMNRVKKPARNYRLSSDLYDALRLGLELSRLTEHYFDVTYEMPHSGLDAVRMRGQSRVDLSDAALKIDLTGLAKGYIVDKIVARLKRNGKTTSILVAAGGDIAHFSRKGERVAVNIQNPFYGKREISVTLGNQAVSTSGFYERGRHIKNTHPGKRNHAQVSVIADACAISDGLSTGLMFMPVKKIENTLKAFPKVQALVYEPGGGLVRINSMANR